jgi:hypothetical protein
MGEQTFKRWSRHGVWERVLEWALSWQCLDHWIADTEILKREVEAWKASRNDAKTHVRWRLIPQQTPVSSCTGSVQQSSPGTKHLVHPVENPLPIG